MNKTNEKVLFFLRISQKKYNDTLCKNYQLYMNPQLLFHSKKFTSGQNDSSEGLITNLPMDLSYSDDGGKCYKHFTKIRSLHKDNNAYIFCVYSVAYDKKYYDSKSNTYLYKIPWKLIKTFWQGNETEMLIILDTSTFIDEFYKAAKEYKLIASADKVQYDLNENLQNIEYIDKALNNPFLSIFHKKSDGYKEQNEFRFSIINPSQEDHYLLQLDDLGNKVKYLRFYLPAKRDIMLEVTGLKFAKETNELISFSSVNVYYSDKILD